MSNVKNIQYVFVFILLMLITLNISAQLIPDFSMSIKVVDPLGEDSVVIGLSEFASAGYNEGYDIIDTSALQLPVDLRIYDPAATGLLNDNCKHFSTSYLSFPIQNIHQIEAFEREFILALRIDLNLINNDARGYSCTNDNVLKGTHIQFNLEPLYSYQFTNSAGFNFSTFEILPSGNIYLEAFDGIYWATSIRLDEHCIAIIAYPTQINTECNIDIYFKIKLSIENKFYVGLEETSHNLQIYKNLNQLHIKNILTYKKILLFDANGKLLLQQNISRNNVIIDISPYGKQMYLLHLSDPSNSHFLTHKILNL